MVKYKQAIQDNLNKLNSAEFKKLSDAVDASQKAETDAKQVVSDQQQLFSTAKINLLRGAENKLAALDTDVSAATTKESEKAKRRFTRKSKMNAPMWTRPRSIK